MCGVVSGKLKEQYPNFGPREWLIFIGIVLAILAGNVVNLIFNIYKYQSAAKNPVTSISQENIARDFPPFTLAMCLEYDLQGIANSGNTTLHAYDITGGGGDLPVKYAGISNDEIYLDCWLIDFPAIGLKVPKKVASSSANPNAKPTWDGYKIEGAPQPWDESMRNQISKSRMKGIFRAYPPGTTKMPDDFDEFDYDNVFQLLTPGYEGSIPVSYKESYYFGQPDTPVKSFPLSQFRTLSDVSWENYTTTWSLQVDAKGLNKQKTVTREDTTFGVAALFAALLSIFNISLTIFALFFPTQPLVVAQTYFRFNSPPKFDPTRLDAKSQQELMISPKSPSRANSRAGSRPASPGPGDEIVDPVKEEVALTLVPDKRETANSFGGSGDRGSGDTGGSGDGGD